MAEQISAMYMSVVIAADVSQESYAAILENSDELLGMTVNVESLRVYNDAEYFSHIIGYIGNISTEELEEYNNNLSDDSKYNGNVWSVRWDWKRI